MLAVEARAAVTAARAEEAREEEVVALMLAAEPAGEAAEATPARWSIVGQATCVRAVLAC
jgi:hypothetical protein